MEKKLALQALREYYDNYVIQYGATQPDWVKSLQYFIDWLKTAKEDAITYCSKRNFFARKTEFQAQLHGYHFNGDVKYTRACTATYDAFLVGDKDLPGFISNFYYSTEADKELVPGNLTKVAAGQGLYVFRSNYPDFMYDEEKTRVLAYEITSPIEDTYLKCTISYPYKEKFLTLNFIVYGNKCFMGKNEPKRTGGCYVATAVYGSYDCPQVWTLRRYRDNTLSKSCFGRAFIRLYYAVSPTLVKWFGKNTRFQRIWKKRLDKMIDKLNAKGIGDEPYQDIDWEKK